jgi:hypothetical protein
MADKSQFYKDLLTDNKERHRLCMDFGHIDNLRDTFAKMKADGLVPSDCEPICIYAEGHNSVWLISKREERTIIHS